MKIKKLNIKLLSILLSLIILTSCSRRHPLNLTVAKNRVEHYYEAGHYCRDLNRIIDGSIMHFKHVKPKDNSVVIFDIDETILSGYEDEKSIAFGFIPKLYHKWIMEADAPTIKPVKRFYEYLIDRGFKIIFLTGRQHNEYHATVKNLKDQGFTKYEKLIVRSRAEEKLTAQKYKTAQRKKLVEYGYKIVGNIGDQWSDLKGGYSGYKIKIPNYRYSIP